MRRHRGNRGARARALGFELLLWRRCARRGAACGTREPPFADIEAPLRAVEMAVAVVHRGGRGAILEVEVCHVRTDAGPLRIPVERARLDRARAAAAQKAQDVELVR